MPRGRPKTRFTSTSATKRRVIDRKPIRPLERQRMRPWLMDLLDQRGCNQLVWLNRREKVFRVAWKHAAGQTFDADNDASLFQLWAQHTGKFYEGDKPDAKKWKANFRCALNSLPDVDEDKMGGIKKGNNAFKVYRFLDEKKVKKQGGKKAKLTITIEDNEEYDDEYSMIRKIGTKSRPRKITNDGLDSEGSENGSSPVYENSDSSDWEVEACGRQELAVADDEDEEFAGFDGEEEFQEEMQKSPLPNFDQLGQQPFNTADLPKRMQTEDCPQVNNNTVIVQDTYTQVIDTYSPVTETYNHLHLLDDVTVDNVYYQMIDLSNDTFLQPDMNVNIVQQEIICTDDQSLFSSEGNVIVQHERSGAHDYMTFTSMDDL